MNHAAHHRLSSGLRIVYFGTPEFAAYILRYLKEHGENIVGVVTTPDKPQGRGQKVKSSAVKETATSFGIPVLTPTKHRDPDFLQALAAWNADIFVVVAYKILPKEVFSLPRLGSFNVHASLLPKYRGAAPINWAIIRGEERTGVTTFLLDDKIDTGNTLIARSIGIAPDETAGELHDRLMDLGAETALESLRGLADGSVRAVPQPVSGATTAPKIFPANCVINFTPEARDVHNFIRGMSPHPGATVIHREIKLKLLRSRISSESEATLSAGKFKMSSDGRSILVGTGSTPLEILELQREGKRAMTAQEFLRGNRELFT